MNSNLKKILTFPAAAAFSGLVISIISILQVNNMQFAGTGGFTIASGPTNGLASLILSCGLFMAFLAVVIYNMGFMRRLSILWMAFFAITMGIWIFVDYNLDSFEEVLGNQGNLVMVLALCSAVIFLDVYFIYSINQFAVAIHLVAMYVVAGLMILVFGSYISNLYDADNLYTVINFLIPANFIINGECIYLSYRQTREKKTLGIMISLYGAIIAILIDMVLYQAHSIFASILSPFACLLFLLFQMYLCFRDINRNLVTEREKEEVEKERLQNQMSTLYSQIQPHFIFNALNTIGDLCITDPEEAENAVIMFSKYLRSNISFMDGTEMVRFVEELNNVKNYFELEKLRFGDAVNMRTDIRCVDFDVPLLSIQPLVENCIKHGLRPKRGGGTITVSTYEDEENNYVTIADDGVGFDVSILDSKEGSVGTKNVKRRIELYAKGKLEIRSTVGEGSFFKITIPKAKNYVDS